MLYMLFLFLSGNVVPMFGSLFSAVLNGVMPIIIMLAGIMVLFSIVGLRVSAGLGTTVVSAIISGIAYCGRIFFSAIGWCLRHFILFIPVMYISIRNGLRRAGMSSFLSNLLTVFVVCLIIVVII